LTDETPGPAARRRHLIEAAIAGAAALAAITAAHSALPSRHVAEARPTAARPEPAAPPQPPVLIAFSDPVPGHAVVSPFGLRQMPWEAGGRLHAGVDIAANAGEAVRAAADGVVTAAGMSSTYGRYVAVRHAEGLTSFYAHLGAIGPGVVAGVALKAGMAIGRIGSSGTSTGPHLHFEIRDPRDRPLNPSLFLGRAFAEAEDLPLSKAQRFGGRVRIAHVSTIPANKRALMEAKLEAKTEHAAALDAASVGADAVSYERIEGLKDVHLGADGRPRASLSF
jgi:murein DD-endopeptidase MepM/ murein hydrolase activator NlpD